MCGRFVSDAFVGDVVSMPSRRSFCVFCGRFFVRAFFLAVYWEIIFAGGKGGSGGEREGCRLTPSPVSASVAVFVSLSES